MLQSSEASNLETFYSEGDNNPKNYYSHVHFIRED